MYENDISTDLATRAYSGISMVPEERAVQVKREYCDTLHNDYTKLLNYATTPEKQQTLDDEFERYRETYRRYYQIWLQAKSRCLSVMITGPSNFPTLRNAKRNASENKHYENLTAFRQRALKAIKKSLCPELAPIMAGDSDAVQRLTEKIAKAEQCHAEMKAINAAHKAFLKSPASLDTSDFSEGVKEIIRNYKPLYSWEKHPVAPFQLTNSSGNIRAMKLKLAEICKNKEQETTEHEGANARLEDCPADNRVRLFFPGKPAKEIITKLKGCGFRWAPSTGAWQAYRNYHSIELAKQIAA